jgi:Flp pilus assembly protein TadG
MSARTQRFGGLLAAWRSETNGAAAVELAIVVPLFAAVVLNIADLSMYAYDYMQVQNAAQMGAEAVWATCNTNTPGELPATNSTYCPNLNTNVSAAVGKTFLGSQVTLAAGSPSEGYYCTTTSGALQLVGTGPGTVGSPPSKPSPNTCAAVVHASDPTAPPGDYIQVRVTYTYRPVFQAASIVSVLGATMTQSTTMRLG